MNHSNRFEGKVALITGGGGEIGLVTARRLASEGASIALMDVDTDKLGTAVDALVGEGTNVEGFRCDVTDSMSVATSVARIVDRFKRIDLLFNNAGYQGAFEPIQRYPDDDFETVLKVNVLGAFKVLKEVAAQMIQQGAGAIVNTASMAGVQAPPNMAAYAASKFAVVGLTETAAKDLAPHGIRVNAISPGFIGPGYMWERQIEKQASAGTQYFPRDTHQVAQQMINSVPMRRYGRLAEIPGTVAFLMSDDASYMTGVNVPICGG